ncbi:exocyst complex component 3-like protein 4 [Alosa pseudoharengus]|uniref:exocyst complex component 3-like protein 4 n=1 Tax=Alosa pseudoharengus TaxID=34774 RepID=UPI003F89A3F5
MEHSSIHLKLGFEMADRVSNGAPNGEERSSGATKKQPKAFSTSHRPPKERAPIPALFMAAVAGAGSPGEKSSMFKRVDSVRRSMCLTKKEKSPRLLTFSPDAEVQKVTKGSEVSQSYTLSPDPSASPSGAASPGMNAIFKRMGYVRRSLGLTKKETSPRQRFLPPIPDAEVQNTEVRKVTKSAKVTQSAEVTLPLSESYTLPPGPSAPPSVMEVNNLIDGCDLLGALVNLLCLREEVRDASPVELAHLEKDLHLLYGALRTKMAAIVRQSSALPARNKELLVQVARVVQEEEQREGGAGGLGGWRDFWRDAVRDGVRDVLQAVHLDTPERNTSWLAVHLGLLGKAIVENLERVKAELQASYPPSFRVFDHYVDAWHGAVTAHLTDLIAKVTEVKDSYALLDFICNQYESERILGNIGLQPDMREELRHLTLEEELLNKIKDQYCKQLKAEVKALLEGVIRVERETLWEPKKKSKERDEAKCPLSPMVMDIRQMVAGKEKTSRTLSTDLGLRTTHICLKELEHFPTELEREFSCCVRPLISPPADVLDQSLWVTYHITYINSFIALREHMESYKDSSPDQVTQLSRSLEKAKSKLTHTLLQQLKTDISPFTASLMTKHWLNDDEDFKELCERVQNLYDLCTEMKQPQLQELVKQLHLLVMREYVASLLHSSYSCKGRKNHQAAEKLQEQWTQLSTLFQRMKSSEDWLNPLGDHLGKIIGQKNESDITKAILQPLVTDFPDISEKQLQAVLNFRASMWTPERMRVQHRVAKLKQQGGATHTHRRFFTDMQ